MDTEHWWTGRGSCASMLGMGIAERRAREREQRRADIIAAAWSVAEASGWGLFSMEKVAAAAELGRATVYGYFASLEALVATLAEQAKEDLERKVAAAVGLAEALDVPVRLSQRRPAAFALLFPPSMDLRPSFDSERIRAVRAQARDVMGRLTRVASRSGASLPGDFSEAVAIVSGVSLAGAVIPELQNSTPLRRRWQEFCLGLGAEGVPPGDRGDAD